MTPGSAAGGTAVPATGPRSSQTIVRDVYGIRTFLIDAGSRYSTLRQVTHADIAGWLASRPRWSRLQDASTLRTLFGTLEAERLIFANPARAAGHWPVSLLKNLGG